MAVLAGALTATGMAFVPGQVSAAERGAGGGSAVRATKGVARDASVRLATGERLERIAGTKGFRVAAAGGRPATGTYAFAQADGELTVQPLGGKKPLAATTVRTDEAGPGMTPYGATATQKVSFSVANNAVYASAPFMRLWNTSTWQSVPVTPAQYELKGTAYVAPGTYFATMSYMPYDATRPSYLLVKTFTVGSTALNVAFDEKAARPMGIVTDDTTARRSDISLGLTMPGGDTVGAFGFGPDKLYVTPFSVTGMTADVHEVLTKYGSSQLKPSPYRYDLVHRFKNSVPANPVVAVQTAGLAKTVTTFRSRAGRQTGTLWSYRTPSETEPFFAGQASSPVTAPGTLTEYVTPNVKFSRRFDDDSTQVELGDRTLPSGTSAGETIGQGPLQPGAGGESGRSGSRIVLYEPYSYSDVHGHRGADYEALQQYRLTSRGTTLVDSAYEKGYKTYGAAIPQSAAPYAFTHTTIRRGPNARLSTKLVREWTFTSDGYAYVPRMENSLPLLDVVFTVPQLDIRNTAPTGTVRVATAITSRTAVPASVTGLEYSTDDGRTWQPASAEGDITVGTGDRFVSLRATGKDDSGATVRTTLIRAFGGPGSAGLPDEKAGDVTISGVTVNGGRPIVVDGVLGQYPINVPTSFTATSPAGIARVGMILYKGSYERPDAVLPFLPCAYSNNPTTATCANEVYVAARTLGDNALAGTWKAAVWAESLDGTSYAEVHAAQTVRILRPTRLTTDAAPEPVAKGAALTVTGRFTASDWLTGGQLAYPGRRVLLEFRKAGTSAYTLVDTAYTDSTGKASLTLKAGVDGEYRWIEGPVFLLPTAPPTTASDAVDVR
ncbi:hypothetical protein ACWGK1_29795 [Streptomyces wedmorensis]